MVESAKLTPVQSQVVRIVCELSTERGSGIAYRDIIRGLAIEKCKAAGITEITEEAIAAKSCAINNITGHIERIVKKTGKTLITWEDLPSGEIKPNSLRAANMAAAPAKQDSPYCRNGSGWSIVVVGDEVAFTIFSEMGIVKHDRIALVDAIAFCDKFKIPAELAVIDRIAAIAEKQAKMAALATAKVTA